MKFNFSIRCKKKNMLRIQDHTKDISYIMGYIWKWLVCMLNRVLWFVSIILNFNALYDAYTVQIQSVMQEQYNN